MSHKLRTQRRHQGELMTIERKKAATPPPKYTVWLLNDDYTPMDFVVVVLRDFFNKDLAQAELIMLKVHTEGKAVCGEYPRDIAESKVVRVTQFAREHGHPLQCVLEGI